MTGENAMLKRLLSVTMILGLLIATTSAFAETQQGRTIAYEPGKSITIIPNKSGDMKKTDYALPTVTYTLSADTAVDIPPVFGGRMRLDPAKLFVRIYNPTSKAYEEISIKMLKEIAATPDSPEVKDKIFPQIDKANKTITEWSPRQGKVFVFTADEKYLALPPQTWVAGNEVLIHFTQAGKADKIENLTKKKK